MSDHACTWLDGISKPLILIQLSNYNDLVSVVEPQHNSPSPRWITTSLCTMTETGNTSGRSEIIQTTYCCSAKGFSISAEPSTGLNNVMVGPRRTTKPRVLTWGSGSEVGESNENQLRMIHGERMYLVIVPPLHLVQDSEAGHNLWGGQSLMGYEIRRMHV